jgi:hypothetical protein
MRLDARAAKQLLPDTHLPVDGCPGLRLEATASRRSWTYRYKSPVDGRMRQVKIGEWPAMPVAAAAGEWEKLRTLRDAGADPALAKRDARASNDMVTQSGAPTVREVCRAYLIGHVDRHRREKGAAEVRRMFATMLDTIAAVEAHKVTRRLAFDLIESFAHVPVQASKLRAELGAAWDYALDAGRVPENTPNWWRLIMRGRLKSRGKKIAGEKIGAQKRVLNEDELGELIDWLPNFSRLIDDVLTMYMWTGTRGAEIVVAEGREMRDEDDGLWWTIPKAKTKNARHSDATDLRVPIIGRAEKIVRRRVAQFGDGFLFPSESDGGHTKQKLVSESVYFRQPYSEIRSNWTRARLTVTHWAPHDLRRSVRTLLASMDCPHEVGEAILGHMLPGVGGVYNLYRYDSQRRDWLTRLSNKLEALASAHLASLAAGPRSQAATGPK